MILDDGQDPLRVWQYAERYLGAGTRAYSRFSQDLEISEPYHPQLGLERFAVPTFRVPPGRGAFLRNALESATVKHYQGGDGFLLPVHPETLAFPGLPDLDVLTERGPDLTVVPSANARTVFVERIGGEPVEPHFVKLHYPRRLSRFTRRLRRPIISVQLWVAEELSAAGLPVLPEVAAGVLGADPAESWGFLVRETRPRGPAAATPRFTVPLFALYGQDVRRPDDPPLVAQLAARSGEDPAGWLAGRVIAPMVRLWLEAVSATGCVPEPHGQNTLVAFDPDGRRTAILYRDCGVYVDPATRADLGLTRDLPPVNVISRDIRQPRERVFSLTYDSFMGHHALERLARVAADTLGVDPEHLRRAAREAFAAGPDVELPPTVHYYEDRLQDNGRWDLVDTGEAPAWR
ncbi:IucA/IucC family C-terminal-domain containing protein [Nonomuraea sp. NPDC048826]|uniref:IucA/IucC family C-terminal-domain containing protein n=1 Tax=Nonomuraea sp. NPDC048826 TaxID=3364347 RepID=UPI003712235B